MDTYLDETCFEHKPRLNTASEAADYVKKYYRAYHSNLVIVFDGKMLERFVNHLKEKYAHHEEETKFLGSFKKGDRRIPARLVARLIKLYDHKLINLNLEAIKAIKKVVENASG